MARRSDDGSAGIDRRHFLKTAVAAAGAALCPWASAGCGAKIPSGLFFAGRVNEFPLHVRPRRVANTSIFVLHHEAGFAALSGQCTQEGSAVDPAEGGGFACPDCGSTYAADGSVTGGPATEDMAWFEVLIVGGEVQIDPSVRVTRGTFVNG